MKIEINFSEDVPTGVNDYAFVLTIKGISISGDGQRHFDIL